MPCVQIARIVVDGGQYLAGRGDGESADLYQRPDQPQAPQMGFAVLGLGGAEAPAGLYRDMPVYGLGAAHGVREVVRAPES